MPICSFSHTKYEEEPWFDLDLGEQMEIQYIDLWSRVFLNGSAIETIETRIKNFWVLIADTPFDSMTLQEAIDHANYCYLKDNSLKRKFSLNNIDAEGRYIRIQAIGTSRLVLAEVEGIM